MAKYEVQGLKRTKRGEIPFKLTDRMNPELLIEGTLRKLGPLEFAAISERADALVADHVTGYGQPGQKGYMAPVYLPPIDGEPVIFGVAAARIALVFESAQIAQPVGDRYSATEVLGLMTSDDLIDQIEDYASQLVPLPEVKSDTKAQNDSEEESTPTPSNEI